LLKGGTDDKHILFSLVARVNFCWFEVEISEYKSVIIVKLTIGERTLAGN